MNTSSWHRGHLFVYIYMYTCKHACICIYINTYICVQACLFAFSWHLCMYTCSWHACRLNLQIYMYTYVCTNIHVRVLAFVMWVASMHIYVWKYFCTFMYTYTHVCMNTCPWYPGRQYIFIKIFIYKCTCTHACIQVLGIRIAYMYICTYMYVFIYICTSVGSLYLCVCVI